VDAARRQPSRGTFIVLLMFTNIAAAGVVATGLLSNHRLLMYSHVLYACQLITLVPCVLARTRWLSDSFLPSTFALVYFLVNLTLGAYLVPRGYGWNKEFSVSVARVDHYPLIVAYLMTCNTVLAWLSLRTLSALQRMPRDRLGAAANAAFQQRHFVLRSVVFLCLFTMASASGAYTAFSLQLGLMIMHLADPALHRHRLRWPVYAIYLATMIVFNYENKREIAMAFFLILFLEAHFRNTKLSLSFQNGLLYIVVFSMFLSIVILSSLLRGYGNYSLLSIADVSNVFLSYIGSEIFYDVITDNLELNYNYGVTITSMDLVMKEVFNFQYGASIIKPIFLPFSRDFLTWKPESVMQIFTQAYAPDWWAEGGSMPVSLGAEMFINFHIAGFLALGIVIAILNIIFVVFPPLSITWTGFTSVFMTVTVLLYARGSGLEQYLLYYIISLPVFVIFRIVLAYFSRTNKNGEIAA
jgi:hypothetical protein